MEKQWEYKVRSGIYGLCVADALGVPGEGRKREELRQEPITEMVDSFHHLRGQPKSAGCVQLHC